jgi:hypothetical protein
MLHCVDYANQPLPSGYDLVFSRDSLQRIPMHGAWQFLNSVKASGAKYLLVGSYIDSKGANRDIAAGEQQMDRRPWPVIITFILMQPSTSLALVVHAT